MFVYPNTKFVVQPKGEKETKSGPALSADKKRVYNLSVLWLQDYLEEVFYKTDFAITFNRETS